MNTLREVINLLEPRFYKHSREVHEVEIQRPELVPTSRELLNAEQSLRGEVDDICRDFANAPDSGWPAILNKKPILIFLVDARCHEAIAFALWLDEFLESDDRKNPQEWIEWLLVDSWPKIGLHVWRRFHSSLLREGEQE